MGRRATICKGYKQVRVFVKNSLSEFNFRRCYSVFRRMSPWIKCPTFFSRSHSNESYRETPSLALFIMVHKMPIFDPVHEIVKFDSWSECSRVLIHFSGAFSSSILCKTGRIDIVIFPSMVAEMLLHCLLWHYLIIYLFSSDKWRLLVS